MKFIIFILVFAASNAFPAEITGAEDILTYAGAMDGALAVLRTYIDGVGAGLYSAAKLLFTFLAALELSKAAIEHVTDSGADAQKFMFSLIKKFILLWFVWGMMGNNWPVPKVGAEGQSSYVLSNFLEFIAYNLGAIGQWSGMASNPQYFTNATPSGLFDLALTTAWRIFGSAIGVVFITLPTPPGLWSGEFQLWLLQALKWTGFSVLLGFFGTTAALAGGLTLLILAFQLFATTVEASIAIPIGLFFLAGGASRWTQGFMEKAINYATSVGVKFIVIYLMVGACVSSLTYLQNDISARIDIVIAAASDESVQNAQKLLMLTTTVALLFVMTAVLLIFVGLALKVGGVANAVGGGVTSLNIGSMVSGTSQGLASAAGSGLSASQGLASAAGSGLSAAQGVTTGAGAGTSSFKSAALSAVSVVAPGLAAASSAVAAPAGAATSAAGSGIGGAVSAPGSQGGAGAESAGSGGNGSSASSGRVAAASSRAASEAPVGAAKGSSASSAGSSGNAYGGGGGGGLSGSASTSSEVSRQAISDMAASGSKPGGGLNTAAAPAPGFLASARDASRNLAGEAEKFNDGPSGGSWVSLGDLHKT